MRRSLWSLVLLCLYGSPALAQRDLTPVDVVTLKSVSGVYPSRDGARIAFTRSEPRLPTDQPGSAYTTLYLLDVDGQERPLAAGDRVVSGVAWRPDGSAVTFLERRPGDEGRRLYAVAPAGGAPTRVFETTLDIGAYRWRPDGRGVAFTASQLRSPERAAARERGFTQRVMDEDWSPTNLYLWTAGGAVRQLVVAGSVFDFEWSPDGTRLALAVAPRPLVDDSYMFKRIHVLDVTTGAVRQLVDNPGKLGGIAWSPDGTQLAYVSAADRRDPHAGMLYVTDARSGVVTPLTPGFEGMVHDLLWLDDRRVRAIVSRGIESSVADLDLRTRRWTDLTINKLRVEEIEMAGRAVAAVMSGPAHPSEVYTLVDGTWTRRTISNPWLDEVVLTRQAIHRVTASDGVTIEGILLYPRDYQEGTRYPLVIVAHGGPESHYGNQWVTTYNEWGQLLSRAGYFVWYPNYRSSTGRGVAFAKADHGDPMGREFQDHLDAIDDFVRRGWVDRARVGIGGGSYGGYTAAWAATRHTEHFAAAVSFVPITWVPGLVFTSDIPWEFYYVHYEEQWPHQQWDLLQARSPLTYAPQTRTPLLLAGGTSDPRVHPSQPFMLYRAVAVSTETPVRYVQYPGEVHGNRTNVFRYDYVLRALQWFTHYLRPGDHRKDAPPPYELDYGEWIRTGTQ